MKNLLFFALIFQTILVIKVSYACVQSPIVPYEVVYECIQNKEGSKEYSKCMQELLLIDEIYLKKQKLENQLFNEHSIFLENKISLLNEKLKKALNIYDNELITKYHYELEDYKRQVITINAFQKDCWPMLVSQIIQLIKE